MSSPVRYLWFAIATVLVLLSPRLSLAANVTSAPASLTFSNTYVGKVSSNTSLTLTKNDAGTVRINSVTFSSPVFTFRTGEVPHTIGNTILGHYSFGFAPTQAITYTGTVTFSFSDGTSLVVALKGTGLSTNATAVLNQTSVDFGNVEVGATSATQTIQIHNGGINTLKLNSGSVLPAQFTLAGASSTVTIKGGQSALVTLTFTPDRLGPVKGTVDFTYDVLPDNGLSLTGTGVASSQLRISTLATLPAGTQNAAYSASLLSTGGTGSVSLALTQGSTFPPGLTGFAGGLLGGTLTGASATTYTFAVTATDAAAHTNTRTFSLPVSAATGGNCGDIAFSATDNSGLLTPLDVLGTGLYMGQQGGLYALGSNTRPAAFDASGVAIANSITPLDSNGNSDPVNGKIGILGLGVSSTEGEFDQFGVFLAVDPSRNSHLVFVDAAQGGETYKSLSNLGSSFWLTAQNYLLPASNINSNQVVVAMIEDVDSITTAFPADATAQQAEIETMLQNLHSLFPNLKLAYFSSRIYGGYSNGIVTVNPEPFAFESAFAVKFALADQIIGLASLNWDPAVGPVKAPWGAWGPYYWGNGMTPRPDNSLWTCQDMSSDGLHPATPGRNKVSQQWLSFFKTDTTATPWFLTH